LCLVQNLPMIDSHVFPAKTIQKYLEGMLEMNICPLDEGILIVVKVLICEIDALAVHLPIL
jgi:hypothetical protein